MDTLPVGRCTDRRGELTMWISWGLGIITGAVLMLIAMIVTGRIGR
jgi:hypothetical protein